MSERTSASGGGDGRGDVGHRSAGRPVGQRASAVRPGPARPQRRRRAGLAVRTATRRRGRRRLAVRITLIVVALVSALGLAGVATAYALYQNYRGQLPDAATLSAMEPPLDTHVYDRDGNLIAILHGPHERHEHIALARVSRWARLATVDVEDRHFYEEGSWDAPRIVKAAYEDLRGSGTTQGASTITQQLAKIAFLGFGDRSFERKAKQVILGIEIENNFTKDQILEMYMNRIGYGNNSIGIESAAETYFHKTATDLDLAEASMLAGLPNSPAILNPLRHADNEAVNPLAKHRQHIVLAAMVNNGDITQAQADAAFAEPLTYHFVGDSEPALTNFTQYVKDWLDSHFGGAYVNPGGWEVHTTLNPPQQRLAEQTLQQGVAAVGDKNAHDGALIGMDPRTGEIMSMVGTANPSDPNIGQFNAATSDRIQPGSTIKLFTYTAAIASRLVTMRSPVVDVPTHFLIPGSPDYVPKNYDRSYHGTCQLAVCLGNSFNIPAVKVERKVGIPYITDLEIAAGLTSLADPANRPAPYQWSATLGGLAHGISPLQLADGAATIADLGIHHEPAPVLQIIDRVSGKTVFAYDPSAAGNRVVPANAAFIVDEMTSNDHNRVREFGAHSDLTLPDRRVSAKTGTTEDFVANWTVGWTPDLVSVVWVGNASPSCLNPADAAHPGIDASFPYTAQELAGFGLKPNPAVATSCGHLVNSTGITGAAPIWNTFMRSALLTPGSPWYTKPPDVLQDGSGDDAYFYLPGTTYGPDENRCYHYGPAPDPGDTCVYTGTGHLPAPPPPPPASPTPGPGAGSPPHPPHPGGPPATAPPGAGSP